MQKHLVITTLAALGLAACSSTGVLQSSKGDNITGTLTRGLIQPYRVEVNLDGKVYRGEWRTGAPTPAQKAATTRPHRKHIGEVQSQLKADDGSTLDCRWDAHGDKAEGACTSNGREYPLVLK